MLFANIHTKFTIIEERKREREREIEGGGERAKQEEMLCYIFVFFAVILIMNICVIRFKRFVSK